MSKKINFKILFYVIFFLGILTFTFKNRVIASSRYPQKVYFSEFPLGVAFGFLYQGETFMPYIKELNTNITKLYIYWGQVEPKKGKYDWTLVDKFLNQLDSDSQVLIATYSTTSWGTKAGIFRGGSPPLDMDSYYNFVFNLVKHCNGKVAYWQNDCEPNSKDWWQGTKEEYVDNLKVFYKAVKKADAKAKVIVGGHNGIFVSGIPENQPFFDYVFEKGKDYFDIFDLRLYRDIYKLPYQILWFRRRMKALGCVKPMVCTEYGGPMPIQFPQVDPYKKRKGRLDALYGSEKATKIFIGELRRDPSVPPQVRMFLEDCGDKLDEKRHRIHCRDIVARTVMALSAGVKKLWYWDLVNDPHLLFGKFRLMDKKLKKKYPAFYAYQRMAEKLSDIKSIRKIETGKKNIYLFEIERAKRGALYVIWERRDAFYGEEQPKTHIEFELPEKDGKRVRLVDVFGNEGTRVVRKNIFKLEVDDTPLFVEWL